MSQSVSPASDSKIRISPASVQKRENGPRIWIALLGVDGVGKSTILDRLEDAVRPEYSGLHVFHRRPRIAYQTKVDQQGVILHYAKPPHGLLKSVVKLGMMVLDWHIGYRVQITKLRRSGALVIADRHSILDLIVDPLRYRYGGPGWLVRLAARLTPMPDLVILLDAPVEVLQSRKSELNIQQMAQLREAYLQLGRSLPNCKVVNTSQPLAEVILEVKDAILSGRG